RGCFRALEPAAAGQPRNPRTAPGGAPARASLCPAAGRLAAWPADRVAAEHRPDPARRLRLAGGAMADPAALTGPRHRLELAGRRGDGRRQAGALWPADGPEPAARPGRRTARRTRARPGGGR